MITGLRMANCSHAADRHWQNAVRRETNGLRADNDIINHRVAFSSKLINATKCYSTIRNNYDQKKNYRDEHEATALMPYVHALCLERPILQSHGLRPWQEFYGGSESLS